MDIIRRAALLAGFSLTFVCGLVITDARASTLVPGTLAGSPGVSATGAASYSIPISLPAGVHGMQPSLALVYNSQSADGLAGYGWTVAGLSSIVRCVSTVEDDITAAPITLTGDDNFCLDGRLLRLTSGTPDSGTATFETQIKDFATITSSSGSSTLGGPDHFTVQTKDGRVYEYGNTSDSQIVASGTAKLRAWALDKVTDANGNYMTYQYDTSSGREYWPTFINYTRNGSRVADHQVEFDYITRATGSYHVGYQAGSIVRNTRLLSAIKVNYVPTGATTLSYNLAYGQDSVSNRNRLMTVQECATGSNCFPATQIAWNDSQAGWGSDVSTGISVGDSAHALAAHLLDVDGDGIDDLVFPDDASGDWKVMFGQPGGGFNTPVDTGDDISSHYKWALALDYDGDGRMDLIQPIAAGGWQILKATGDRTSGAGGIFTRPSNSIPDMSATNSVTTQPIYAGNVWMADVTGDGVSDLVDTGGTLVQRYTNSGPLVSPQDFASAVTVYNGSGLTKSVSAQFVDAGLDFDGSGRISGLLLKVSGSTYTWEGMTLSGSSLSVMDTISASSASATTAPAIPFDSNGDGLTDLLTVDTGNHWQLSLSEGDAFNTLSSSESYVLSSAADPVIADYFGDGSQVALVYNGSAWRILDTTYDNTLGYSMTAGAAPASPYSLTNYVQGGMRIGHIDASGLDDLVYVVKSGTSPNFTYTWHYKLHNGYDTAPGDTVSSVTDGMGNECDFNYVSTAAGSSTYSDTGSYTFPVHALRSPLQVVSSYAEDKADGSGGLYTVTFTYANGAVDTEGHGFLGFGSRTVKDGRNNNKETITYHQDFPYVGMVTQDLLKNGSTMIRETDNTVDQLAPVGSMHNRRYFPFYDTSTVHDYDNLGGTVQEVRRTLTTVSGSNFDSYGNLTATSNVVTDYTQTGSPTYETDTTTGYAAASGTYCAGLPSSMVVTRTVPAGAIVGGSTLTGTRTLTYTPDTTLCQEDAEALTNSADSTERDTAYQYDTYGNVTETDLSGTGLSSARVSQWDYTDSAGHGTGEFPTSSTGVVSPSLNLTAGTTWDYAKSIQSAVTDPNGNSSGLTTDSFGRAATATKPDGSSISWAYAFCPGTASPPYCPTSAVYEVTVSRSDGTSSFVTGYSAYDMRGRVIQQGSVLLGGVISRVDTTYDAMGNVASVSKPYIGSPGFETTYTYDLTRGRITEVDAPQDESDPCSPSCLNTTTYAYSGFTTTATHTVNDYATASASQVSSQTFDAIGEVLGVVDAKSGTTAYNYGAFGELLATEDAASHVTALSYDGLGHKTGMVDPNMGTWSYQVDALGEVICQTDAKGQSIIMAYDGIGRVISKLETAAGAGCAATSGDSSTFTYDTATDGLGLLASMKDMTTSFERDYAYDIRSRPSDVTTKIPGAPHDYTVSTTYDSFGRVATITYPESVTPVSGGSAPTAVATITPTGPVNTGTSITLHGESSTDPNGLGLQYQWTQTGGPALPMGAFDPAAATTSFTPAIGGTYGFQLQVIDSGSSMSTPQSVSIDVKPPAPSSAPTLSSSTSVDGTVTVTWGSVANVDSYVLYKSTTANGTYTAMYSGITAHSKAVTGLGNGTHFFKVGSTAGGVSGDPGSSHSSSLTVTLPPGAPTVMAVPGFSAPSTNFTGSWSAPTSGTVTKYELQEDNNSGFSSPTTYTITAPTHNKTDLNRSVGTWYYRVRACNGNVTGACGSYSNTDHVVVENIPLTPTMNAASPSSISIGDNSTLSWTKHSGDTVTFYNQQTSTTGVFTSSPTNNIGNITSQVVHPTVTRYYRVQACNDVDCGPWSSAASVTVSAGGNFLGGGGTDDGTDGSGDDGSGTGGGFGFVMPQSDDSMGMLALLDVSDVPVADAEPVVDPRPPVLDALHQAREALVAALPKQPSEASLQARFDRLNPALPQTLGIDRHGRPEPARLAFAPPVYQAYAGARHQTVGGSPFRFTVQYVYDPTSGAMEAVANADTGFIYWRAATGSGSSPVDAFGHLVASIDGNNVDTVDTFDAVTGAITSIGTTAAGSATDFDVQQLMYTWDGFGNLKQRCDLNRGLKEIFGYDDLNRVTASTVYSAASTTDCSGGNTSGNPAMTVAYDAIGNITGRTNTGITVGGGTLSDTYSYGDSSHPYAVTAVTSITGTYAYDANGNMTSGNGRTITWNDDNLPLSITAASGDSSTFSYGPDMQRYQQQVAVGGVNTATTSYVGGLFEVITQGSAVQYRHSIMAAGGVVAVHTLDGSGNPITTYIHSDHLGSSDTFTDETGSLAVYPGTTQAQTMSFDAFGLRRNPDTWQYDLTGTEIGHLKDTTDKGYTSQEQLDNVGLVHMNGRVYDPGIGRMVSADPTVPDPFYSQAFNRYVYVYNNPMAYTDPSGFTCDKTGTGGLAGCKDFLPPSGQPVGLCFTSVCSPTTTSENPTVNLGCDSCGNKQPPLAPSDPGTPSTGPGAAPPVTPTGAKGTGGLAPVADPICGCNVGGNNQIRKNMDSDDGAMGWDGVCFGCGGEASPSAIKEQDGGGGGGGVDSHGNGNGNGDKKSGSPPNSQYWDHYRQFVQDNAIDPGPYVLAIVLGVVPKSIAPATNFRGPLLGSQNTLTSTLRAIGVPGARSTIVRIGTAGIGIVTIGIGFYDATIEVEGLIYAIPGG